MVSMLSYLKVQKKDIKAFDAPECDPNSTCFDYNTFQLIAISESVYGVSAALFLIGGLIWKCTRYSPLLFSISSAIGLDKLKE